LARGFDGSCRGNAPSDDHIHLELHELHCRTAKIDLTFSRSHLEHEILPLALALLGKGVAECQECRRLTEGALCEATAE